MKDIVDFLPTDAVAWLRIAEGDTRFPIRPVPAGDFLIGSGADCDLRLGDGVLPPLHSVLRATASTASWTRLVREPDVFVNGESVRQSTLQDGDLVEIGPFRLLFRFATAVGQNSADHLPSVVPDEALTGGVCSNKSAAQLVDAIEVELELLAAFDRNQNDGIVELLAAAARLARSPVVSLAATTVSPARPSEADATYGVSEHGETELSDIQRVLQLQATRIDSISEVLENLIRQQRLMTEVLHSLTARVGDLTQQQTLRRRAG